MKSCELCIPHLGDSTFIFQINLFAVLAPRKPHLRSDTSQSKTPSVSDPERILHRRGWRERPPVHTDIPEFSLENFLYLQPSSSQVAQIQSSNPIIRDTGYYSDSPYREGTRIKDEAESSYTPHYSFHPTPEVEEVKEVTEVSVVDSPTFSSSS